MKTLNLTQLFVILILSACGSPIINTQVPTSLPDLAVKSVHIAMQGIPGDTNHCVPAYAPYEVRVTIENRGDASAANISVVEPSSGFKIQVEELAAGQTMKLSLPVSSPNGSYNVSIDPQNLIAETNEDNNTAFYLTITPTPPALCLTSATPLPTQKSY